MHLANFIFVNSYLRIHPALFKYVESFGGIVFKKKSLLKVY